MAEARAEEDERLSEAGARRGAAEHSDRNKPDQRRSSQGPLSSIRAVIKRTSTRPVSQSDHHRDRRRPEITILSAEPLPSNSWFPGASGAFPPAPPPAPPSWSASSGTVQLPPPSYEQVIKEKSREQNLPSITTSSSSSSSSPLSSRHSTSTIATQTDTDSPGPQSPAAHPVRRPPKPPRPSPPLKLAPPYTDPFVSLDRSDRPSNATPPTQDTPSKTLPEDCGVQTDFNDITSDVTLQDPAPTSTSFTQSTFDFVPDPMREEPSARPRPRPRSKVALQAVISEEVLDQPMTREVKVQTLVRLKDDGAENLFAGFSDGSSNFSSKYLQDLLEVFGSDEAHFHDDQHQSEEEEEEEDENGGVAVISKEPSEPVEPLNRPQPLPRTQKPKPLLAPKPSALENEVFEPADPTTKQTPSKQTSSPPVPAPRPLLSKRQSPSDGSRVPRPESASAGCQVKAVTVRSSEQKDSEDQAENGPSTPEKTSPVTPSDKNLPKRPSVLKHTRPPPPLHRKVSSISQVADCVTSVSEATDASVPRLPPRPSGGRLLPLRPPPIKLTKPAGPSSSPVAANQLPGSRAPKRGPPLPPRPKPGHPLYKRYSHQRKVLQGDVGLQDAGPVQEEPSSPDEEQQLIVLDDASVLQTHPDTPRDLRPPPEVKGEDLLENSSFAQRPADEMQPHTHSRCVARFAFAGEEGELTFSQGDVITLTEYVNEEWGRGCLDGRVGIFPLNFIEEETEAVPESAAGGRSRGKTLYDFSAESEDELCLKAGDVVSDLEDMDGEWFLAEFGGKRGIVPKNYIQVLPKL